MKALGRQDAEQDAIHHAAAEWFSRLQDREVAVEDTLEWQRWMAAHPRHAAAFNRIQEIWMQFEKAEQPARPKRSEVSRDVYEGTVSITEWRTSARKLARNGLRRWALAASVAVVALSATLLYLYSPNRQVIQTAIGENRSERLNDGSQVTLGGNSRLEVSMRDDSRRLTLVQGEALFSVAKDPLRPFSVRAGTATVTATGTSFNVRRGTDRVLVTVLEGSVQVEPQRSAVQSLSWLSQLAHKPSTQQLKAGLQTIVHASGFESAARTANPATATAWRNGQLTFEGEPLKYVLEDVNRYATKPIALQESAIGELTITGTIANDNVGAWISSLEKAFELRAVEEPERILLIKNPPIG